MFFDIVLFSDKMIKGGAIDDNLRFFTLVFLIEHIACFFLLNIPYKIDYKNGIFNSHFFKVFAIFRSAKIALYILKG